jgi:hypothetical protein
LLVLSQMSTMMHPKDWEEISNQMLTIFSNH